MEKPRTGRRSTGNIPATPEADVPRHGRHALPSQPTHAPFENRRHGRRAAKDVPTDAARGGIIAPPRHINEKLPFVPVPSGVDLPENIDPLEDAPVTPAYGYRIDALNRESFRRKKTRTLATALATGSLAVLSTSSFAVAPQATPVAATSPVLDTGEQEVVTADPAAVVTAPRVDVSTKAAPVVVVKKPVVPPPAPAPAKPAAAPVAAPKPAPSLPQQNEAGHAAIPHTPPATPPPAPAGGRQATIAAAAYAQLGARQDCTMLVTNSLRAAGISYHGWPVGYFSLGAQVPASQAIAGDLIYYANGGTGVAHIAVYVGNGMAIHGGWNGNQTVLFSANVGSGPVFIRVR